MLLIFMGTPAVAVPALERLHAEHEIALVVTQPDKMVRRGRKMELTAPPVKQRALELGLPVAQPERARDAEFVAQLEALKPQAIAVVAYGQILPRAILEMPTRYFEHGGCVNSHFSLLPRWRGAAPAQYAVLHGDTVTGVTTQWMAERLDAGDVILQREVPILPDETAGELLERLTPIGAEVLAETLRLLENGTAPRLPQDESAVTLAPTIRKEDGLLDWGKDARALANQVRAYNPWPVAFTSWHGETLRVWKAAMDGLETSAQSPGTVLDVTPQGVVVATGAGSLALHEVQPAGKARMAATDWARGARVQAGDRFE